MYVQNLTVNAQKIQKSQNQILAANRYFIAVYGLRLSRLKNFSHSVSQLDLPTLFCIKHIFPLLYYLVDY